MAKYETTWLDYQFPGGRDYSLAVCSYSGRIRHMIIGKDFLRRTMITSVEVNDSFCTAGAHCLDKKCKFNTTEREHMAHMLDMWEDEELDEDTAKIWGTSSTVNALVMFAEKMNGVVSEDMAKNPGDDNNP